MKYSKKQYLEGRCAAFALAAHRLLHWPIFIAKIKSRNGLGTHAFVYRAGVAFDANGYYRLDEVSNIEAVRKVTPAELRVFNKFHLHLITPGDVKAATTYIKKKYMNRL